jgi:hypothetical protein
MTTEERLRIEVLIHDCKTKLQQIRKLALSQLDGGTTHRL